MDGAEGIPPTACGGSTEDGEKDGRHHSTGQEDERMAPRRDKGGGHHRRSSKKEVDLRLEGCPDARRKMDKSSGGLAADQWKRKRATKNEMARRLPKGDGTPKLDGFLSELFFV